MIRLVCYSRCRYDIRKLVKVCAESHVTAKGDFVPVSVPGEIVSVYSRTTGVPRVPRIARPDDH